jgi:hypothetical protein
MKQTAEGINAIYAGKKDRSNLTRFMIESPFRIEPILNKALERHWKYLNIRIGCNLFWSLMIRTQRKAENTWRVRRWIQAG